MYHHLEHSISLSTRTLSRDCQLQSWLNIKDRVEKGMEDKSIKENLTVLVDSAIYNHPMRRYNSTESDRPLIGMQEFEERTHINRHSLIIRNTIDDKDYLIDCMSEKFRSFIPAYSDSVPLGAIVNGIINSDIEKAKDVHKILIKNSLKEFSGSLNWFKQDVIITFKEKEEEWQKQYLKKDLEKLLSNIKNIKMVAHFDISKQMDNLVLSIEDLLEIDFTKPTSINKTKQFQNVEQQLKKSVDYFKDIEKNNNIKNKPKKTIKLK
jgi:hypothetical protein